jgi:hypothetical protein
VAENRVSCENIKIGPKENLDSRKLATSSLPPLNSRNSSISKGLDYAEKVMGERRVKNFATICKIRKQQAASSRYNEHKGDGSNKEITAIP